MLVHQQILSGIKEERGRRGEEKKERGEDGGGGGGEGGGLGVGGRGVRLGLCRNPTFFHPFLGPPFFSVSAASVFGRRPGGRETMARCADL